MRRPVIQGRTVIRKSPEKVQVGHCYIAANSIVYQNKKDIFQPYTNFKLSDPNQECFII